MPDTSGVAFHRDVLQSQPSVRGCFTVTWCSLCGRQKSSLRDVAAQCAGSVTFGVLDIDQSPDAAQTYRGTRLSRQFLFNGGTVVGQLIGSTPQNKRSSVIEVSNSQTVFHVWSRADESACQRQRVVLICATRALVF